MHSICPNDLAGVEAGEGGGKEEEAIVVGAMMAGLSVADPPAGGENGGDASAAPATATTVAITMPRTGTRATTRTMKMTLIRSPFAGRSGVRGNESCPEGAHEQGGFGEDAVRVQRSECLRAGW